MPSSAELVCVDPKRVHEIWPHVEPLLRRAIVRTGLAAFEEVADAILTGRALLWLGIDGGGPADVIMAAASTCLQQTDAGKVCVITACGGEQMPRWLSLIKQIEAYARNENCQRVRIFGRMGWRGVLRDYAQKNIILDKELDR